MSNAQKLRLALQRAEDFADILMEVKWPEDSYFNNEKKLIRDIKDGITGSVTPSGIDLHDALLLPLIERIEKALAFEEGSEERRTWRNPRR